MAKQTYNTIHKVKVFFDNRDVIRVLMIQYELDGDSRSIKKLKDAVLEDPSQPPSEENPWVGKFAVRPLGECRTVFQVVGLDPQGRIAASLAAPGNDKPFQYGRRRRP